DAVGEVGSFGAGDRRCDIEKELVTALLGAHLQNTAPELAGELGGVGFLYDHAVHDGVGEEVQRYHTVERLGAGHTGTIEERGGVAFAETADINVFASHKTQTRHALEAFGDIGIAGAGELLVGQDIRQSG